MDLSKCDGDRCPIKETCKRFLVTNDSLKLSKVPYNHVQQTCFFYLKNDSQSQSNGIS